MPLTGAATVMSDAEADCESAMPDSTVIAETITRRRNTKPKMELDGRGMNNGVLLGMNELLAVAGS